MIVDTPLLELNGITKRFPGVLANDDVYFDVAVGEIHALLGENGAGKSTLMKVLHGLYRPDQGEVRLHGRSSGITTPADAIEAGVAMVHQHFMLVPTLTVAENVALGLAPSGFILDTSEVAERIRDLSSRYGLHVDPSAHVWQLAVGERQRVEIVKALYRDCRLLVLDEPTAVLTPIEVEELFVILRTMAADGVGLIFISHKLGEVLSLADRITVMRDGRVTGETTPSETNKAELADMMVGREVQLAPDRPGFEPGEVRLAVKDLRVAGDRGVDAVRGCNFEVRSGELLGIAGVSGNGQRELAEAIAGLRPVVDGDIKIDGAEVTGRHPSEVRAAGLAYVPEERMRDGVVGEFSVAENLILVAHDSEPFSRRGILRLGKIVERCRELVERFDVKTPTLETTTATLSGGNIQKLILARELSGQPKVLLAAQPTRGVDIGAAEYIHRRLIEERSAGNAILVISEDLDEVLALSDRVAVMFEGRIVAVMDVAEATVERVGLLMAGSGILAEVP
ncbi:MAG: ABC transporter ATP-binding protein [Acidimicrobiales bacterium]|nr:ABC transporter ATP-binding protein [Acidimicrobiales bacterium]